MPGSRPVAQHVVIDLKTGDVTCEHCGDRLPIGLPMPIDCVLALLKQYVELHVGCAKEQE